MRIKIIAPLLITLTLCTSASLRASLPDSLRAELAHLPDSTQVQSLLAKSASVMYRSLDLAERYLHLAFEIAEAPGNDALVPKVLNQRGTLHWIKGDNTAALADYQQAEKLFAERGNALGVAKAQNNVGLVYQDMSYFDLSLAAYLQSARYFEQSGEKYALATLYNNIGNVSNATDDDAAALQYYLKALALFTEAQDTNGMSMCHANLGLVCVSLHRDDEALQHYLAAIQGYEALDYPIGVGRVYHNLSAYYAAQSQFEEAESVCRKALQIFTAAESPGEISISELKLSEVYAKSGRFADAILHAEASLKVGEGSTALLQTAATHDVLATAYEKSEQYALAISHLREAYRLNDTIFNQGKNRTIQEMQLKFASELKDKALENFAQGQRIDALWKWGLGIVIVLLILFGTLMYTRQRAIIRREQALQQKDREMHIAQKALGEAEMKAQAADLKAAEAELKATASGLQAAEAELNATAAGLKAAESERLRLSEEINFKSREITGLAMNIVRRNDLLEVLDRELKALRKGADEQKLKELSILVSQTLSVENERKEFQLYIQDAQQNFFLKLETAFPDLSTKEKRLCAMIVLGLSSKEIAAVFNIAGSSVEVARHRLRKKLNLDANAGLKEFLEGF